MTLAAAPLPVSTTLDLEIHTTLSARTALAYDREHGVLTVHDASGTLLARASARTPGGSTLPAGQVHIGPASVHHRVVDLIGPLELAGAIEVLHRFPHDAGPGVDIIARVLL